eukprot:PhM_4_TR1296/c0_g1_i1/m.58181
MADNDEENKNNEENNNQENNNEENNNEENINDNNDNNNNNINNAQPSSADQVWACQKIQARIRSKRAQDDFSMVKSQGLSTAAMNFMKQKREVMSIADREGEGEVENLREGAPSAAMALQEVKASQAVPTFLWAMKLMYADVLMLTLAWFLTMASVVMIFFAPQFTLLAFRLVFYDDDGQVRLEEFVLQFIAYASVVTLASFLAQLTWQSVRQSWGSRMEFLLLVLSSRNTKIIRKSEVDHVRLNDLEHTKRILFYSIPMFVGSFCALGMGLGMVFYQTYHLGLIVIGFCLVIFFLGTFYDSFVMRHGRETKKIQTKESEKWAYLHSTQGDDAMENVLSINKYKRSFNIKHAIIHLGVGGMYRLAFFVAPIYYMYLGGELVKRRLIDSGDIVFCMFYFIYCLIATGVLNSVLVDTAFNYVSVVRCMLLVPQSTEEIRAVIDKVESVEPKSEFEDSVAEYRGKKKSTVPLIVTSILVLAGLVFFVAWVGSTLSNNVKKQDDLPSIKPRVITVSNTTSAATNSRKARLMRHEHHQKMSAQSTHQEALRDPEQRIAMSRRSARPVFSRHRHAHTQRMNEHHAQRKALALQSTTPAQPVTRFQTCIDQVPSGPCSRPFHYVFKRDAAGALVDFPSNVNFRVMSQDGTQPETTLAGQYVQAQLLVEKIESNCFPPGLDPRIDSAVFIKAGTPIQNMECLVDADGRGLCANLFGAIQCPGRYGIRLTIPSASGRTADAYSEDYAVLTLESYTLPPPTVVPHPMIQWIGESHVAVDCPVPEALQREQIRVMYRVEKLPSGDVFQGVIGNGNMLPREVQRSVGLYKLSVQCAQDTNAAQTVQQRSSTVQTPIYGLSRALTYEYEIIAAPSSVPPPALTSDASTDATLRKPPIRITLTPPSGYEDAQLFYSLAGEEGSEAGAPKLRGEVKYEPALGITITQEGHFTVWAQAKKTGYTPSAVVRLDGDVAAVVDSGDNSEDVCPLLTFNCKLMGVAGYPQGFIPIINEKLPQNRKGKGLPTSLPCAPIGGSKTVMDKCVQLVMNQLPVAMTESMFFSKDDIFVEASWDRWDGLKRVKRNRFRIAKKDEVPRSTVNEVATGAKSPEALLAEPGNKYKLIMVVDPCGNFNGKKNKLECESRDELCEWVEGIERCLDKPCELLAGDKARCEISPLLCDWKEAAPGSGVGLCQSRRCQDIDSEPMCSAHNCRWDAKVSKCFNAPCDTKLRAVDCKLPCLWMPTAGNEVPTATEAPKSSTTAPARRLLQTNTPMPTTDDGRQSDVMAALEEAGTYHADAGTCQKPSCSFWNAYDNIDERKKMCDESQCAWHAAESMCTFRACGSQEDADSCFASRCLWVPRPASQSSTAGVSEYHCIYRACSKHTSGNECTAAGCRYNATTNECAAPQLQQITSPRECDAWGQSWTASSSKCSPRPCDWDAQVPDVVAPVQNYPVCRRTTTGTSRRGSLTCSTYSDEEGCASALVDAVPVCEWMWGVCRAKSCQSMSTRGSCSAPCRWVTRTTPSEDLPKNSGNPSACAGHSATTGLRVEEAQQKCANDTSCIVEVVMGKNAGGMDVQKGWICKAKTAPESCTLSAPPCPSPCVADALRGTQCVIPDSTERQASNTNDGICIPPTCTGLDQASCASEENTQCLWNADSSVCEQAPCEMYLEEDMCNKAIQWGSACQWQKQQAGGRCTAPSCEGRSEKQCSGVNRGSCIWAAPAQTNDLGVAVAPICRHAVCGEITLPRACNSQPSCSWSETWDGDVLTMATCRPNRCHEIVDERQCSANDACIFFKDSAACGARPCATARESCKLLPHCESHIVADIASVEQEAVSLQQRFAETGSPSELPSFYPTAGRRRILQSTQAPDGVVSGPNGVAPMIEVCRRQSCSAFSTMTREKCWEQQCHVKEVYKVPAGQKPYWLCLESCSRLRNADDCASFAKLCTWDAAIRSCVRRPCDEIKNEVSCSAESSGCSWSDNKCVAASASARTSRKVHALVHEPTGVKPTNVKSTPQEWHHAHEQRTASHAHHHKKHMTTFHTLATKETRPAPVPASDGTAGVSNPLELLPTTTEQKSIQADVIQDPNKDTKLDIETQTSREGRCQGLEYDIQRRARLAECDVQALVEALRQRCDLSRIFKMEQQDLGDEELPEDYYYVRCMKELQIPADEEFNFLSQGAGVVVVAPHESLTKAAEAMRTGGAEGDLRSRVEIPREGVAGYFMEMLKATPLQKENVPKHETGSVAEADRDVKNVVQTSSETRSQAERSMNANPGKVDQAGACQSRDCQVRRLSEMASGESNPDSTSPDTSRSITAGNGPSRESGAPRTDGTERKQESKFPSEDVIKRCLLSEARPFPEGIVPGSVVLAPFGEPGTTAFARALVIKSRPSTTGESLWEIFYLPPKEHLAQYTLNAVGSQQKNQLEGTLPTSEATVPADAGSPEEQIQNQDSAFFRDVTGFFPTPQRTFPSSMLIPLKAKYEPLNAIDGQSPLPNSNVIQDDAEVPTMTDSVRFSYRVAQCEPYSALFRARPNRLAIQQYEGPLSVQPFNVFRVIVDFEAGECSVTQGTPVASGTVPTVGPHGTVDPSQPLLSTNTPVSGTSSSSPAQVLVDIANNFRVHHRTVLGLDRKLLQNVKHCIGVGNKISGVPLGSSEEEDPSDSPVRRASGAENTNAQIAAHRARVAAKHHAARRRALPQQDNNSPAPSGAPPKPGMSTGSAADPIKKTSSVPLVPTELKCAPVAPKEWIVHMTGDESEIAHGSVIRCEVKKTQVDTSAQPVIIAWARGEEVIMPLNQKRTLSDGRVVYPIFRHSPVNPKQLMESGIHISEHELDLKHFDDDLTVRFSFRAPPPNAGLDAVMVRIGRDPGVMSHVFHVSRPNVHVENIAAHWAQYKEYRIDFDTDAIRGVAFNRAIQDPVWVYYSEEPDQNRPVQTPGTGPKGAASGSRYYVADASMSPSARRAGGGRLFTPVMHIPNIDIGDVVFGFAYHYFGNPNDMPQIRVQASTTYGFEWQDIAPAWPPKDWTSKPQQEQDKILQDRWRSVEIPVNRFQGKDTIFSIEVVWKVQQKPDVDGAGNTYVPNQGDVGIDDFVVKQRAPDVHPTNDEPLEERFADIPNQRMSCPDGPGPEPEGLKLPEGWGRSRGLWLMDMRHLQMAPPTGIGMALPLPDERWDEASDRLFVADAPSCPGGISFVESPMVKLDEHSPMQLEIRTLQSGGEVRYNIEVHEDGSVAEIPEPDREQFSVFSVEMFDGETWSLLPGVKPWSGIPHTWARQIVDLSPLKNTMVRFRFIVRMGQNNMYPSLMALPRIAMRDNNAKPLNLNLPPTPPIEPCGNETSCCNRWATELECSQREDRGCRWAPSPGDFCEWMPSPAMYTTPKVRANFLAVCPSCMNVTTSKIPTTAFSHSVEVHILLQNEEWVDADEFAVHGSTLFDALTPSNGDVANSAFGTTFGSLPELRDGAIKSITRVNATFAKMTLPALNSAMALPTNVDDERLFVIVDGRLLKGHNEIMADVPLSYYRPDTGRRTATLLVEPNLVPARSLQTSEEAPATEIPRPIRVRVVVPSGIQQFNPRSLLVAENFHVTCPTTSPCKSTPSSADASSLSVFHSNFHRLIRNPDTAIEFLFAPEPSVLFTEPSVSGQPTPASAIPTTSPKPETSAPKLPIGFELSLTPTSRVNFNQNERVCLMLPLGDQACFTITAPLLPAPELSPRPDGGLFHGTADVTISLPPSVAAGTHDIKVEVYQRNRALYPDPRVFTIHSSVGTIQLNPSDSEVIAWGEPRTATRLATERVRARYHIVPRLVLNVSVASGCEEFSECSLEFTGIQFQSGDSLHDIETSISLMPPPTSEFDREERPCKDLPVDIQRGQFAETATPAATPSSTTTPAPTSTPEPILPTMPKIVASFPANILAGRTPGKYAVCYKPNFLRGSSVIPSEATDVPWVFVGVVEVRGRGGEKPALPTNYP